MSDAVVRDLDVAQFKQDGFLLVPQCLTPDEVGAMSGAVRAVLGAPPSADVLLAPDGSTVRKVAYLFDKHPLFLEMLTHPSIMALATVLSPAPDDLVVTWEDLLVKPAHVGIAVPVHQDLALQSLGGGVFSLGVHLDDAADNPVWFLPGSHRLGPLGRNEIRDLKVTRRAEFVPVRARAGDIVLHDVFTAHFSDANDGPASRHTWYLEFRTGDQVVREGPWDLEWVRRRQALLLLSARIREAKGLSCLVPRLRNEDELASYVTDPRLRVPHVGGGVEYDTTSPYFHFD